MTPADLDRCPHCHAPMETADGRALRKARKQARVYAVDLARMMGISKQRLWAIETNYGTRRPTTYLADHYMKTLQVIVDAGGGRRR